MTYNRTILELKRHIHKQYRQIQKPYNRTILELKHVSFCSTYSAGTLIIAPFWN